MTIVRLVVVALCLQMVVAFRAGASDVPPYSTAVDTRMTIHGDLTAIIENTVKQKVLKESAIRTLGQQTISYSETIANVEIVEAYTEKADGTRLMLEGPNILTRDAATGLNAVYQREDRKSVV